MLIPERCNSFSPGGGLSLLERKRVPNCVTLQLTKSNSYSGYNLLQSPACTARTRWNISHEKKNRRSARAFRTRREWIYAIIRVNIRDSRQSRQSRRTFQGTSYRRPWIPTTDNNEISTCIPVPCRYSVNIVYTVIALTFFFFSTSKNSFHANCNRACVQLKCRKTGKGNGNSWSQTPYSVPPTSTL